MPNQLEHKGGGVYYPTSKISQENLSWNWRQWLLSFVVIASFSYALWAGLSQNQNSTAVPLDILDGMSPDTISYNLAELKTGNSLPILQDCEVKLAVPPDASPEEETNPLAFRSYPEVTIDRDPPNIVGRLQKGEELLITNPISIRPDQKSEWFAFRTPKRFDNILTKLFAGVGNYIYVLNSSLTWRFMQLSKSCFKEPQTVSITRGEYGDYFFQGRKIADLVEEVK